MKVAYAFLLEMVLLVMMFQSAQSWAANVASGKSYQLNAAPYYGESANHKDDTGPEAFVDKDTWYRGELTNGVYTTANYFGNCVHLTQQGPISIIVDLRGVYSVTSVKLQACGGGIYSLYYPQKIEVYGLQTPVASMPFDEFVATTDSDNQSWAKLGELVTNETESGTAVIKNFEIAFSAANCKLIKFVLTDSPSHASMNLGEIEVYSTSTPTLDPSNTTLVTFPVGGRNAYFPIDANNYYDGSLAIRDNFAVDMIIDNFNSGAYDINFWNNASSGGGFIGIVDGICYMQCGGSYGQAGSLRGKSTTKLLPDGDRSVELDCNFGIQDWASGYYMGLIDENMTNGIYFQLDGNYNSAYIVIQSGGISKSFYLGEVRRIASEHFQIIWSQDRVCVTGTYYDNENAVWVKHEINFDTDVDAPDGGGAWTIPSLPLTVFASSICNSYVCSLDNVRMKYVYNYFPMGNSADLCDSPYSAQTMTADIIKDRPLGTKKKGTELLKRLGTKSLRFWDVIWVNYRSHIEQVKVVNFATGSSYSIPADDNDYTYPYYNEILDYCAENNFTCIMVVDTFYYDPITDKVYTTPEVGNNSPNDPADPYYTTDPNDPNGILYKAVARNVMPIVQYYIDHQYTNRFIIEIGNEAIGYIGTPAMPTAQQHLRIIKAYATAVKNACPAIETTMYPNPDNSIYQMVADAGIGNYINHAVNHFYAPRINGGTAYQDVDATKAALASAGMGHVNVLITEYSTRWSNAAATSYSPHALEQANVELRMITNPNVSGINEFALATYAKMIHSDMSYWSIGNDFNGTAPAPSRPADIYPELGKRFAVLPTGLTEAMFCNTINGDLLKSWPGKNTEISGLLSSYDGGKRLLLINPTSSDMPISWSTSFGADKKCLMTSTADYFSQTLTQPWKITKSLITSDPCTIPAKSMMLLVQNYTPATLVKQSGTTVSNGGQYNFGYMGIGAEQEVTFTVENQNSAALELTGTHYDFTRLYDDFDDQSVDGSKWSSSNATVTEFITQGTAGGGYNYATAWDYPAGVNRLKMATTVNNGGYLYGNKLVDLQEGQCISLRSTMELQGWAYDSSWGLQSTDGLKYIRLMETGGQTRVCMNDGSGAQYLATSHPVQYLRGAWVLRWKADRVTIISEIWGTIFDSSVDTVDFAGTAWRIPSVGTTMRFQLSSGWNAGAWCTLDQVLLAVEDSRVVISGDATEPFFATQQPASPIATSSSSQFKIKCKLTNAGTNTATVSIPNSDWLEDAYEIQLTAVGVAKAATPAPSNGATGVSINPNLTWVGYAPQHDVYFGTNQTNVTNATHASAEYKGTQSGTTYAPGVLSVLSTYYWRTDEVYNGQTIVGDVWSFTTETPPTFVSAGSITSGTVTITPSLPVSITTGDILLLFIETSNQAVSISNQNGGTWTQVTNSPQYTGTAAGTTGVRLAAYWSRYNGTQGNPTVSDSGNHQMGRIIAIRGAVSSGNPWDVTIGGVEAVSDTSGSIPGATTTVTSTLVVTAIASALPDATGTSNFSSWTNANLTSLTERIDNTVTAGNGGGIGVATGIKATAGAYGNTAVTLGSSAYKAMMSIAIKP